VERDESVGLRRSWITTGIAIAAALLGVQHLIQAMSGLHGGGDPLPLAFEHLVVAILSFVATYAIAKGKAWAPWALAIAGLAAAILVVSLGSLLKMDATARNGLWAGGATIAVIAAVGVWYLAKQVRA